jgi:hypothetical protein
MYRSDTRVSFEIWNLKFLMPAVRHLSPIVHCLIPF